MRVQAGLTPGAIALAAAMEAKRLRGSLTWDELDQAIQDAGWDGEIIDAGVEGRLVIGPMSTTRAHQIAKAIEHPDIEVEVQESFVPSQDDLAYIHIKPLSGVLASAPRPAKVKRMRPPQVDQVEKEGPNPAMMTQTPSVGTVTFDTSMGETMVSSMQDEVPASDPNRKFEVWWVKEDRDGEPRTHYADVAFMTEAAAQAYAKKKGIDRKYDDWGIRDKAAEYAELRQKREARKARESEEIEKAKALLKKHKVKGGSENKNPHDVLLIDGMTPHHNDIADMVGSLIQGAERQEFVHDFIVGIDMVCQWVFFKGMTPTAAFNKYVGEWRAYALGLDNAQHESRRRQLASALAQFFIGDTEEEEYLAAYKPMKSEEYDRQKEHSEWREKQSYRLEEMRNQRTRLPRSDRGSGNGGSGLLWGSKVEAAEDIDLEKSQLTQNSRSIAVYRIAEGLLAAGELKAPVLDYGAGLGQSKQIFKGREVKQYEPYPRKAIKTAQPDIDTNPAGTYGTVVNSFVLNVVPEDVRMDILAKIGALVAPGGHAVIGARGTDVMDDVKRILNGRKKDPNAYPGSRIIDAQTLVTSRGTYQHGFTKDELAQACLAGLGGGFEVVETTGGSTYPTVVLKKS